MLNAAKDRQGDKFAIRRRRLLQVRIRIWNPVDGLRWTRMIVENIFGNDPADVIDAKKDKVVQRFLTQRPIETLDVW